MPTRDEVALALRKADAAGAADDARRLAATLRAMDAQALGPETVAAPAAQPAAPIASPAQTAPQNSYAEQQFERMYGRGPEGGPAVQVPQSSFRAPLVPASRDPLPSISNDLGSIIRGESKNEGAQLLERGATRLGVKEGGRPNAYSESPDILGGLGDLIGAANYGVRDWWRHSGDKEKQNLVGNLIIEGTGTGAIARGADHVGQKTGNEFLQDKTGLFKTDENYDPVNELEMYALNAGSWSARNKLADLINPRAKAATIGPQLPAAKLAFAQPKLSEFAPAAADVATNLTMGLSDIGAAGARGVANLVDGFRPKPGANLPPIEGRATPVQPNPTSVPVPAPAAPTANTPPPGNLQPVMTPRPQAGPISGEYANLHPKVQAAFTRLMESSGVEPQRIPAILRNLDQLPADRASQVATELIKKFGAGDPKLQTNLTAVGRDFTVNTPTGKGDNAQAVVRGNIRQAMDQEGPYIEGVAERNFGPGVVATQEVIDQNLRDMRGRYQALLNPKKPYGNLRSAANRAAIDTARANLANYLKQVDVAQEIPDWLKRDTLNTLNRDLREMKLEPIERSSVNSGFTWAELVDQYPTQIAHALQSTYATASREADMAKLGDLKAGAFKRDMQEMRGRSQVRANAANPADRGYGLLHLLEQAVPDYKKLRTDFGTEHGAKTALTIPERFLSVAGDEVRFADLLDDLDDLTPDQMKTAESQITTLVRNAIRKKQENPTLADVGAGQTGTMTPNLERLAQGPVLDGLEKAFGDKGKELADAIRLSRATTQTLGKIEPDFGPRTASNIADSANAPKLYEDPKATNQNVIDNTAALLGSLGVGTAFSGNVPAALGIMSLAAAKAAWNAIKNGKKLSPEQRTQFAQFLFALRRGEAPEVQGRIEGPNAPPQLPAPSPSRPPVKAGADETKLNAMGGTPEGLGAAAGGIYGYTNPVDANDDGVIDAGERSGSALGGMFSGGLLAHGGRRAVGGVGNALKTSAAPRALEPLELSKTSRVFSPGKPDDLGFITSAEYVLGNPPARFRDAKNLSADQWRKFMREGGASAESFQWQIEPALKRLADEGITGDIPKAKLEEALARTRGTLDRVGKKTLGEDGFAANYSQIRRTHDAARRSFGGQRERLLERAREQERRFETDYGDYVAPGSHTGYKQHVLTLPPEQGQGYKSHNWQTENPVGHVRTTNRTSANGEKVLHVEELQSDLHQEGAKYGYKGEESHLAKQKAEAAYNVATDRYDAWARKTFGEPVRLNPGEIDDPVGKELARERQFALEAWKSMGRAGISPPRAPLENWEEPFIRYALKQGADQGVDVITFPTWDTLHKALQNEGTQKFYDQRMPRHLESVAKSLGLKVERVDMPIAPVMSGHFSAQPVGGQFGVVNDKIGEWHFSAGRFDTLEDAEQAARKMNKRIHSMPAIRLTPEAKQRLSEGIIMDAKDPGRRAPARRMPPVQAGFGGGPPKVKGARMGADRKRVRQGPRKVTLSEAETAARAEVTRARRAEAAQRSKYVMRDNRDEYLAPFEKATQDAEAKLAAVQAKERNARVTRVERRTMVRTALKHPIAIGLGAGAVGNAAVVAMSKFAPQKDYDAPPDPRRPGAFWEDVATKDKATVSEIQGALHEWGNWPTEKRTLPNGQEIEERVPQTGTYGKVTKAAVRRWRYDRGLDPDAPMTRSDLERLLAGPRGYQDDEGHWRYARDGERPRIP